MWNWWKRWKNRAGYVGIPMSGPNTPDRASLEKQRNFDQSGKPDLIDEGEYYGRPVRVYSDGSVKAATRHGWTRFANMEALQEYIKNPGNRANN